MPTSRDNSFGFEFSPVTCHSLGRPEMPSPRVQAVIAKLEKGRDKTHAALTSLTPEQWDRVIFSDPARWTLRDLLAHFYSFEIEFQRVCQEVARGGRGTAA